MKIIDFLNNLIEKESSPNEIQKLENTRKSVQLQKLENEKKKILFKNIQEQYLFLDPVKKDNIIGMRLVKYKGDRDIQFLLSDGGTCYLVPNNKSRYAKNGFESYICPDDIEFVCDALSYYIPRFADDEHTNINSSKTSNYYINPKYTNRFGREKWLKKSTNSQKKKIREISEMWDNISLLYVVGRTAYDEWNNKAIKLIATIESSNEQGNRHLKNKLCKDEALKENLEINNGLSLNVNAYSGKTLDSISLKSEDLKANQKPTKKLSKIKAGEEGEAEVRYVLSWLPKEKYKVIQGDVDYKIYVNNKNYIDEAQEIDHIVIGPQGLFLIETKNRGRRIVINKHGHWLQERADGTLKAMRNPLQQVIQHEKMIRSILKECPELPQNLRITNIVCIANEKTIIEGEENTSLIVKKSDMLLDYIENFKTTSTPLLTQEQIEKCSSVINHHIDISWRQICERIG